MAVNSLTQMPPKIDQAKSPLQEVSRQLAAIGPSGSFATRLTVAAGNLHLEVKGVGKIGIPITPGMARRLCAVAKPARHGFKDETRLNPKVRDTCEIIKGRIPARWSGDRHVGSPPDRLVYLLDHEYTQRGLKWNRLKSSDARRAMALQEVARQLDCEIFLALADVHETRSCEDDYSGHSNYGQRYYRDDDADESEDGDAPGEPSDLELTELIDSDVELRHWLGVGGRWEAVAARVDAAELCYTRPSADLEPFESEHEGYTGNAGNTVEHWYHRAAVVLWPRERTFVIRARSQPN